ncbi:MAG: paraquat-inducible protein A [Gammaproteobacteria bacterium SG8_11]|nr:MAG: paraquat-inducible protein A [Gammaproteobacteria bacterium SG8_11]
MKHTITAAQASLLNCHSCDLLCNAPTADNHLLATCPRCGATLHTRKPNSIARTWALVITAYILYIPANLLPVMTVTSVGKVQSDTIISGVIYLLLSGMWPLAMLVFFASVVVPLAKLFILSYLLFSVQRKSRWRPRDRTRLYRITEAVGRWSMVDIYVVTILVALVKLGALATIEAGSGAVFFAAVVVVTMFAAMAFDPRLIWDRLEDQP